MKISIVVPAHNEEGNLENLVSKLIPVLESHRETKDYELVLVDDNSKDGSPSIVDRLAAENPRIKPVHRRDTPGFGNAIKSGFRTASGDVIIPFMGDLSDNPEDVPKLVQKIEQGYDIAYGSRFVKGGSLQGYPSTKMIANRVFNNLVRFSFGIPNKDVTNAFKAYKREVLEAIGIDNIEANGFDLTVEVPLKAYILGFKSVEVPVSWNGREKGEAKLKLSRNGSIYGKRLMQLFFWGNLISLSDLFGSVIKGSLLGTLAASLLGVVILTSIFNFSGFSNVFEILKSISVWWFLLCCASILMTFILRTWRWSVILRSAGYVFPRDILFKSIMFGWLLNYLIPARVGDLARGAALKTTEDAPLGMSLSTIVVERVFDMVTLFLFLAIPSTLFYHERFLWLEALSLGIALVLLIGLGAVYKYDRWIARWLALRSPTVGRSLMLLKRGLDGIVNNKAALVLCLAISLPIWLFEVFSIFLAANAIGFSVPFMLAAISGVAAFLAQTVPLTPAGLGVHEASITGILGISGVTADEALSIALIDHFARGLVIYILGFISAIHLGFASRWYFRRELRREDPIKILN
jgi:uncharacterized protein (TIRG00374 family)